LFPYIHLFSSSKIGFILGECLLYCSGHGLEEYRSLRLMSFGVCAPGAVPFDQTLLGDLLGE